MPNPSGKQRGFTLVELIISVSVTSIILLGMSSFFSGALKNTFQAQKRATSQQGQFVVNEILRSKFQNATGLITSDATSAVIRNNTDEGQLPFTYIGQKDSRVVFRDFLIFNGLVGLNPSANANVQNPAGMAYIGGNYYVAAPIENKIYRCNPIGTCSEFTVNDTPLNHPTGIALNSTDENTLYISNSDNDEILSVDISTQNGTVLGVSGLNFPTGVAYYTDSLDDEYLFVADTYNHLVKRISLDDFSVTVTAGEGASDDCDNSARYCKLDFPTGLHVEDEVLYIADSGSGRVLRVSEPSILLGASGNQLLEFTLDESYKLDRIELTGNFTTGPYVEADSNLIGVPGDYNNLNRIFTSATGPGGAGPAQVFDDSIDCTPSGNSFNLTGFPLGYTLDAGDKIVVNDAPYTVVSYEPLGQDCDPDPVGESFQDRLTVAEALGSVGTGDLIYFSSPLDTQMNISNLQFTSAGFQQLTITTHESDGGQEEDILALRVGDGVLGSSEDSIEVFVEGLDFPTGLSMTGANLKVFDSLDTGAELKTFDTTADPGTLPLDPPDSTGNSPFTAFSPSDFTAFDYTSDFTIQNLSFVTLNGGQLLELSVEADVDDNSTQTYTLSASLP